MQLYNPTKIFSEDHCVLNHSRDLQSLGSKAMIVTGRHSAVKTGALADVIQALGEIPYVIFDRIEENPSIETVMEARQVAIAEQVDFFIGIGGGSPMDASKAIALMAKNPHQDESVLYTAISLPHYPVACIPTTCGTGSEVTPYAILTRHALQTKKSISHKIFPAVALLDAKYLMTMSRTGLVNTCVDALSHLLESYLNTNTNNLNRVYSRQGLVIWSIFRDRLLNNTVTKEDYTHMLHASMVAGLAITHTGTSLPHGLSYPVTYHLGIPHGRAVGMFLGGFLENYGDPAQAQETLDLLGFANAAQFRAYMRDLLGPVEVSSQLLESAAEAILNDPSKLKNYPFPITAETIISMAN